MVISLQSQPVIGGLSLMFSKSRKARAGGCSQISSNKQKGFLILAWCRLAVASDMFSMKAL